MVRVVLPLLFLLAACSSQASIVQAPIMVNVGPVGSAAPQALAPSPPPKGECRLKLHGLPVAKSAGCYLAIDVSDADGDLTYDCDGDGPAFAVFGRVRYEGSIQNGDLDLHAESELDWSDGCHWGTLAIIRGPVDGKLVWTYEDRVISGAMCSGVCHANSSFETAK